MRMNEGAAVATIAVAICFVIATSSYFDTRSKAAKTTMVEAAVVACVNQGKSPAECLEGIEQ